MLSSVNQFNNITLLEIGVIHFQNPLKKEIVYEKLCDSLQFKHLLAVYHIFTHFLSKQMEVCSLPDLTL